MTATAMESWRRVWREGFAPQLSTAGLEALRLALAEDDLRLIQGATTERGDKKELAGCCALAFCGWKGDGVRGTAKINGYVDSVVIAAYRAVGAALAIAFTVWYDETPRDQMRRELLPEVERELARRQGVTG